MDPQNPDLREKLEPFRRRWVLMACIVVAISALTYFHYKHQPPKYLATTTVFVQALSQTTPVGTDPETDPSRRLKNAATLLETPAVASQVAETLKYNGDPRNLLSLITVSPSADSDFLAVAASTADPKTSAAVANGFANAFVQVTRRQTRASIAAAEANIENQLSQLPATVANQGTRTTLQQQLQTLRLSEATAGVEGVNPAPIPTVSSAPSPTRNAIFAAVLGLVLAGMVVLALEAFSRRLRRPMVEAAYGLPLLGSLPFSRRAQGATTFWRAAAGAVDGADPRTADDDRARRRGRAAHTARH